MVTNDFRFKISDFRLTAQRTTCKEQVGKGASDQTEINTNQSPERAPAGSSALLDVTPQGLNKFGALEPAGARSGLDWY